MTELSLDSGSIVGAGAGIAALLFELGRTHHAWHSVQLDPDNAILVALPDELAAQGDEALHPILPQDLRDRLQLVERPLNEDMARRLAIDLGTEQTMIGKPEAAVHAIELHDDCIFRFVSRDPAAISQVLAGVLALQAGYAGSDGSSALAPTLRELLAGGATLRLRAARSPACIEVLRRVPQVWKRWLKIGEMVPTGTHWAYRG